MRDHPSSPPFPAQVLALLTVLAAFLGGSTELWARGVLLLSTAVVLIIWPPRRSPGAFWVGLALIVAGLAATAFLPARWFAVPRWRLLLTETFEVPLSTTISPQPWLTLEGMGFLWAALIFALALLCYRWEREDRQRAARTYALGILLLAGLALASLLLKWPVPWWPKPLNSGLEFGFFPNRNQTANVLALAGVMSAALGFAALNRRHKSGYGWFAGVALLGAALVTAYSRAGIAMFFAGTTVWVALGLRFSASKKGATLGFAAVLVLLAGFFLYGGETLKRFQSRPGDTVGDFRMEIQRDAWRLAAEKPWLGQGLGNFEPLLAVYRTDSALQKRVLHPESDWLWGAVELGWPAVALVALALAVWFRQTLPFASGTDRHLRSAAAVCGVAFALHGLIDVSAHRAGALWPALLLFSLARHPQRAGAERPWVAPLFRLGGLLLAALGGWWLVSAWWPAKTQELPTSSNLAWLVARAERENAAADYPAMLATTDEALRIAPLDWTLYYRRGVAHAASPDGQQAAAAAFDVARFLEPRSVDLCLNEGKIWLALENPQLTIEAWVEALRRAGSETPGVFRQMLAAAGKNRGVRAGLARIAEIDPQLFLLFLESTQGLDFESTLARLLQRDPTLATLSPAQRRWLFSLWYRNGDRDEFVRTIVAHPEWLEEAWLPLAQLYARKQDFERAWRFVERYGPVPVLPQLSPAQSLAELERAFHLRPDDLQAGLGLYTALRRLRQNDEALATLRALNSIRGRPVYVPYLEAVLSAEKSDWPRAWEAWERYAGEAQIR